MRIHHQPATDLASRPPGLGIAHEAARRIDAEGPGAERSWQVGAEGERIVAGILERLTKPPPLARAVGRRPRWRVLHSVPLWPRPRDVDHLLIGPPGVVTINTKHHPEGRLLIDGESVVVGEVHTRYVAAAREEGELVGRLLRTVAVHPMITVVGGLLRVVSWPAGVTITTAHNLVHTLGAMPVVFGRADVEEVYAAARRASTWRSAV